MRLATVQQSQQIDHLSQKSYALSSEILMEAAGCMAAKECAQSFFPELLRGTVAIVCGPGNNGGDGLVMARHLHSSGHRDLIVFLIAPLEKQKSQFKLQKQRAEAAGLRIVDLEKEPKKTELLRNSTLVIDAMFGIGLSKAVEGIFLELVDVVNALRVPVLSLDCPTGLDCDRGVARGAVIKAAMTLTFGLAKPGFFVADGPRLVGKLKVLPIGFPHECLRGVATTHFLFNEKLARRYLPRRKERSNKSDFGHVLVVAGESGMWGAGVLAASSAYRIGAGYVTWMTDLTPTEHLGIAPEILTADLNDNSVFENKKFSVVALGPGLKNKSRVRDIISRLKKDKFVNVVLDAEAIRVAQEFELFPLPKTWILTPHAGELGPILGLSSTEIDKDRFEYALKAAKITGCHVLVKGYRSVLAYGSRCLVIQSGNSALAKAGTGDVLTGMIAGLLAQGLEPLQATATAAFLHGKMADDWVRRGQDKNTLVASDLKNELPGLMARLAAGAL